jgi:glycyl-tRNA synthetase beta chain
MPALLLEIGLEEIPAGMVAAAQAELARRIESLLTREALLQEKFALRSYSTPRRLAVLVEGLLPRQADSSEEVVGPSVKVAYKDGVPTPAALAFARKSGVEVSALRTIQNPKGEYVAATVQHAGRTAAQVLSDLLPAEIAGLYWPKNMYWRAGKPERFVRPVRWLLALLDHEILPLQFAGITADGVSYGHRVLHGDSPVVIAAPQEYVEKLAGAYVEVDPEVRRHRIRKALDAATRQIPGARWREDEQLVDVVTHLTEWPSVVLGSFDASYLTLPEEVLVTVMRDHQKYFALEDANGKLLPNFLAVLNIEVDEAGAAIIRHGNERVLRARFNDARFFWDVDQKIPLVDRVEMLKNVTFQKDLGSYWDKTERNKELARYVNNNISQLYSYPGGETVNRWWSDGPAITEASRLAKCDLTTEMVKEFTELQGIVGGLYAAAQGMPAEVANAIYDQYKPTSPDDDIPRSRAGCVVALADKLSTIVDMFAIGLQPTGSKDPLALRRAGNGIVRILVENGEIGASVHLAELCRTAFHGVQGENDPAIQEAVYRFLLDRFEYYLQENLGIVLQVSRAIRNSGAASGNTSSSAPVGFAYVTGFARALNNEAGSSNVTAVAELLKRTSNILRQAREKKISFQNAELDALLREPAEQELSRKVSEVDRAIQKSYRAGNYSEVIAAIASLQQPLNAFFDSVMVMVDDSQLRENRLALLSRTESVVRWAADFSELASI